MSAKPQTELLIFDFDGTLYDTVGGIHKAVNTVAEEKGVDQFDYDLIRSLVGFGLNHLIERLDDFTRNKLGALPELRERFREVYNSMALSESSLYPGVLEFLRNWSGSLAIVSNKEESSLKKMLQHSPLSEFSWLSVFGGDSLSEKKPHPLPIDTTLEKLNKNKESTLFIGDGVPDLLAAQAAGVRFLGASFGYASESELRQLGAQRFFSSYSELPHKIQELDALRLSGDSF